MCYFAHPTDGDKWHDARPSGEPPLHYLTDDEYRLIVGRHRSPGRLPGTRPAQPYQPRRRSISADRDRRSPGRRHEIQRSPGRPRSKSRDRERLSPSLASRIRGRSPVRDGRDARPYGYRNSRSRSPALRGRIQPRTPPPPVGGPKTPHQYSSVPDGPRNGSYVRPRTPVLFPKVETVDVPMQDVMKQPRPLQREESISSTHVASHPATPLRIPGAAATGDGPSSMHVASGSGSGTTNLGPPFNIGASLAAISGSSSANIEQPFPHNGSPATGIVNRSASIVSGGATPSPDAIKSLLETSTVQWQQISSAVAAATSAVPKTALRTTTSGDASGDDSQKIWASRIE